MRDEAEAEIARLREALKACYSWINDGQSTSATAKVVSASPVAAPPYYLMPATP